MTPPPQVNTPPPKRGKSSKPQSSLQGVTPAAPSQFSQSSQAALLLNTAVMLVLARPLTIRPDVANGFPDVASLAELAFPSHTSTAAQFPFREAERRSETYLTWTISRPSLTSCGRSFTSLRFWAGSSTVLTPARRAPISFSLIPPTAVMRPRKEISPCVPVGRVRGGVSRGAVPFPRGLNGTETDVRPEWGGGGWWE